MVRLTAENPQVVDPGDDDRALAGGVTRGEIDYLARRERVTKLADIVMRRTTLAISGALTRAPSAAAIVSTSARNSSTSASLTTPLRLTSCRAARTCA